MQNRIREYREAKGLTQADLGEKLGVTSFTIMRWEKEYTSIPDDRLLDLARFFQVTPTEIVPTYGRIPEPAEVSHA